jgi:hypothetical protein
MVADLSLATDQDAAVDLETTMDSRSAFTEFLTP